MEHDVVFGCSLQAQTPVEQLVEYAGMEVVRLGLMMFESRTFAGCCWTDLCEADDAIDPS